MAQIAFAAFFIGMIFGISISLIIIVGLLIDIRESLRQFKSEGNDDKWLK